MVSGWTQTRCGRRVSRFAFAGLAGALLACVPLGAAHASYPGARGLVALVTTRSGSAQIWAVDPATGVEHKLSRGSAVETTPAWSPFGTRLAFTREGKVWVMNADGTGSVDLTASDAHSDGSPTWSPDGAKIAFASDRDTPGQPQIYVMRADGSHATRLTNDTGVDSDPQWSPDGTHIAFVSTQGGNSEIYSMRANGYAPRNLSQNTAADENPSWSPDGSTIVFTSGRARSGSVGADLWLMQADGSQPRAFLHESNGYSDGDDAAFSPDGADIVFSANNGAGSQQLWVAPAAGGENTRLTNDTGNPHNTSSDWQPVVPAPTMKLHPHVVAPSGALRVSAAAFAPGEGVRLTLKDAAGRATVFPGVTADANGAFAVVVTVPAGAALGQAKVAAVGKRSALAVGRVVTISTT
jgi:Tol biopolymer transport system component